MALLLLEHFFPGPALFLQFIDPYKPTRHLWEAKEQIQNVKNYKEQMTNRDYRAEGERQLQMKRLAASNSVNTGSVSERDSWPLQTDHPQNMPF